MTSVRTKIIKHALLPGYIPRISALFSQGFVYIAWFTALIYESVRLLPPGHPYLNPVNIGSYGVRHVIAAAADNLVVSRKTLDQVFIFCVILVGFAILLCQFAFLLFAVLMQNPVFAEPLIAAKDLFFVTSQYNAGPDQDIAFNVLDRVFGIQGIFESCVSDGSVDCMNMRGGVIPVPDTYPWPMHKALHAMLRFYSLGIFFIGVIIITYFVITVTAETAVAGSPFGQRINKAWFPIRLIMFFALLVPLNIGGQNEGLNAAQIITFWVAKGGSNFATNAWGKFNEDITTTYLGEVNSLVAVPQIPELKGIMEFMFIAKTCKMATEGTYPDTLGTSSGPLGGIQAYLVRPPNSRALLGGEDALDFRTTDFKTALKHANNGNIRIRFGARDTRTDSKAIYRESWGNVFPHCGDITIPISDLDKNGAVVSGSALIQGEYYDLIQTLWEDPGIRSTAECIIRRSHQGLETSNCNTLPGYRTAQELHNVYAEHLKNVIQPLIDQKVLDESWEITPELRQKGWAGAAIWYNKVAQMNGEVTTAIYNIPTITDYPAVMQVVAENNLRQDENIIPSSMFDPNPANAEDIKYENPQDRLIAGPLYAAYMYWHSGDLSATQSTRDSGSALLNAINWAFGTGGLWDIRDNISLERNGTTVDIHPLAQLSSLGSAMMFASVRNIGVGFLGNFLGKADMPVGEMGNIGGEFFNKIGIATLAVSFVLYYILPFLPFIYFLFAVSGWIKSIFEAIVAMPLWALAHLRGDGEGLPGTGATNGYFLLLEIFLRPILMLFGLLASLIVFSTMVAILNDIFDLIIHNVGGFNHEADDPQTRAVMRNTLDEFMFTVMYTIICFMIGQSCFKLIDQIPNQIMRWTGFGIAGFQEQAGDPAAQTTSMTYQGINLGAGQLHGGALALLK